LKTIRQRAVNSGGQFHRRFERGGWQLLAGGVPAIFRFVQRALSALSPPYLRKTVRGAISPPAVTIRAN